MTNFQGSHASKALGAVSSLNHPTSLLLSYRRSLLIKSSLKKHKKSFFPQHWTSYRLLFMNCNASKNKQRDNPRLTLLHKDELLIRLQFTKRAAKCGWKFSSLLVLPSFVHRWSSITNSRSLICCACSSRWATGMFKRLLKKTFR